jgi:uncharacterized membrane-anchored protein YjiN (DUF445 family)
MLIKGKESKKIATYSLVIMGIGFIATLPFQDSFLIGLLRGGFEAGLVGGLADWFAVTALFRHPLGIPIPHTALLPKNRDRMTNALVNMLKNDWLSKESIQDKVKYIHFTEKLIAILEKQIQTDAFRKIFIELLKRLIRSVDVEKVTPFVKKHLVAALSNIEMSKLLQLVSSQLLNQNFDKKMLDFILTKLETWLKKEISDYELGIVTMRVINMIELEGFQQFALKSIQNILNEEKLGGMVKNLLMSVINSLQQENQPNREALISFFRKEIQGIADNAELLEGVEKWKDQLLVEWEPETIITTSLTQLQQKALELVEDDHFHEAYLMPLMNRVLTYINDNHNNIDQWVQKQITILVEKNHSQIGNLVKENLDKLDIETLIDMMENNIGKDLQWIRVNGAICGFFIGILLTIIQALTNLI